MDVLNQSIQYIKGVGEKRARLFAKLGIFDVGALLAFYPRGYEDWSRVVSAADAPAGEPCCIRATLTTSVTEHRIRQGMTLYKCSFTDESRVIHVTLFNNRFLANSLELFQEYLLYGKVEKTTRSLTMASPQIARADAAFRIHPVYPATEGLSSKAIEKVTANLLDMLPTIPETLPDAVRRRYQLCTREYALRNIHFPEEPQAVEAARRRLMFEELLLLQLAFLSLKRRETAQTRVRVKLDLLRDYETLLPFALTGAQRRTLRECLDDMASGQAMNRLVQGDVGSGKTAVAAGAMFTCARSGYQCAMMAPTEILAIQHYETLQKLLEPAGLTVALLTGSVKAAEKRSLKEAVSAGDIDILVGTHALIQADVAFENLGLVVTDEQHRFGVEQRAALLEKGSAPHMLVMSATPIPRTLALVIYGDLDVSVIDELPSGRKPVDTFCVDDSYRARIYRFIQKELDSGRQAYMVCPLVEEGDSEELAAASTYAQMLSSQEFRSYRTGLLHGKLKPREKDAVMQAFVSGDIQLLIATTVVEVGVDVPNASVMLIENAERFGLSQLHQLRGRVGRGTHKSYCILICTQAGAQTKQRMKMMCRTNDGFQIAQADLKLRGPGDFFGKRQHGLPVLKIADMLEDMEVLEQARDCAGMILKQGFDTSPDWASLRRERDRMLSSLQI